MEKLFSLEARMRNIYISRAWGDFTESDLFLYKDGSKVIS